MNSTNRLKNTLAQSLTTALVVLVPEINSHRAFAAQLTLIPKTSIKMTWVGTTHIPLILAAPGATASSLVAVPIFHCANPIIHENDSLRAPTETARIDSTPTLSKLANAGNALETFDNNGIPEIALNQAFDNSHIARSESITDGSNSNSLFGALSSAIKENLRLPRRSPKWSSSASAKVMSTIEAALKSGDQTTLIEIINTAKAHRNNKDLPAVFNDVVLAAARLARHELTGNSAPDIGSQSIMTWTEKLSSEERIAINEGVEGPLALRLKSMQHGNDPHHKTSYAIREAVNAFKLKAPFLSGQLFKTTLRKLEGSLDRLEQAEKKIEERLYNEFNASSRKRVSDRLYNSRTDFASRRDRAESLKALHEQMFAAKTAAAAIDNALSALIMNLKKEAFQRALVKETQDASRANELAKAATLNVSTATDEFLRLQSLINTLHDNKTIQSENLASTLSVVKKQLLSGAAIASVSQAVEARRSLVPIRRSLVDLLNKVSVNRKAANEWVDGEITADLKSQMTTAQKD